MESGAEIQAYCCTVRETLGNDLEEGAGQMGASPVP